MKTYASLFLLAALSGLAQADGLSAGQDAQAARVIAHAYATQTVQDQTQVRQGYGLQTPGAGATLQMNIGNVYANGSGQVPRENFVYVKEAVQICLHCD